MQMHVFKTHCLSLKISWSYIGVKLAQITQSNCHHSFSVLQKRGTMSACLLSLVSVDYLCTSEKSAFLAFPAFVMFFFSSSPRLSNSKKSNSLWPILFILADDLPLTIHKHSLNTNSSGTSEENSQAKTGFGTDETRLPFLFSWPGIKDASRYSLVPCVPL